MRQSIEESNFFTGANPYAICDQLGTDSDFAARIDNVVLHIPWTWRMSTDTWRLVYAISFRRR